MTALAMLTLAACTSGEKNAVDGVLVYDAEVQLNRGARRDTAVLEFTLPARSALLALVDENDTDVKVRWVADGAGSGAPPPVEVENEMRGEGMEVALFEMPRAGKATLTLEGAPDWQMPGRVKLRVLRFDAPAADRRVTARLAAWRAWTAATLADHHSAEDLSKAGLTAMDGAIAHFEAPGGDAYFAAWARLTRGYLIYWTELDWREALAEARRAAAAFEELRPAQQRNVARARYYEASALLEIANDRASIHPTAAEASTEGRRLLQELHANTALSALERARCTNNLGYAEFSANRWSAAVPHFEAAIIELRAIGNRGDVRSAMHYLAGAAQGRGDFRTAARIYDELLLELDAINNADFRALLLQNAAKVDLNAGNIDRAIDRLLQALELSRKARLPVNEARSLMGLGLAYWSRGDLAQAETFFAAALRLQYFMHDNIGIVRGLRYNGLLARERGDISLALTLHRYAESRATNPMTRGRMLLEIALDLAALSDHDGAITKCREALTLPIDDPLQVERGAVQVVLAEQLLARELRTEAQVTEAAELADQALRSATNRSDLAAEIAARRVLALVLDAHGDGRAARAQFEQALQLIFEYRSGSTNPELRATTLGFEQAVFRDYVDLLMRRIATSAGKLQPASAGEEDALRVLELARAANLDGAQLARVDAAKQARIDALLASMANIRVRIASLRDQPSPSSEEISELGLESARLRAEVDRIRVSANGGWTQALAATPGARAWRPLPRATAQLSYALGNARVYLWVRDSSGIRVTTLAADPKRVELELAALAAIDKTQTPELLEQRLAQMSAEFLPREVLRDDVTAVDIVAEGRIASVPFAALHSPRQPTRRLIESHSVTMIGSLFEPHAGPRTAAPRPLRVAVLSANGGANGGATGGALRAVRAPVAFPNLPATANEAHSIAELFLARDASATIKLLYGADGNAAALEALWIHGADVVHFATHGLADLRQPLASMLMLPAVDAAGSPTYLTAGQVQEWRGDADLVFLSACETAVGQARFADGIPGLQRAFLRAGAHGVIATLWPVEDAYASQFATDFYERYTAGASAARALSETQRAWLVPAAGISANEQAHRRMTAWAHAFYTQ
jgi:CHAT domain-containing protein